MENDSFILVTGGAGYIGSVVVKQLIDEKYKVIVIDDLRDGKAGAIHPEAIHYKFDFGNYDNLTKVFSSHKIFAVMHLAASANVPDSVINPFEYYNNNFNSSLVLLHVMKNHNVRKIIFSSTAAVYGNPNYVPIDENHPTNPINPYGHSKLFIEQVINDFALAYNFKYVIFRYFCAAGATKHNGESRSYETHLIPNVLDTIIGKKNKMYVFGNNFNTKDGTGVRDYIHVSDISNAHLLALLKIDDVYNEIFNLGSNSSYSVLEIIKISEKTINSKVNFEVSKPRPGDPDELTTISDKANLLLNWKPNKNIEEIILSAYNWRNNNLY
jgi:UDP-glucose 4-epimerase